MMVLKKRRVLVCGLVIVLAVLALAAVSTDRDSWRYVFTWDPTPSSLREPGTSTVPTPGIATGAEPAASGEAQADFFLDFRLDRERTRGQQLEQLREIINNTKVDEEARREAAQQWLELTTQIGKELELEGLIKAKGWSDCVVFVQPAACTVVVKGDKLSQSEAAQIGDIVVRGTGINPKDVTISTRGG